MYFRRISVRHLRWPAYSSMANSAGTAPRDQQRTGFSTTQPANGAPRPAGWFFIDIHEFAKAISRTGRRPASAPYSQSIRLRRLKILVPAYIFACLPIHHFLHSGGAAALRNSANPTQRSTPIAAALPSSSQILFQIQVLRCVLMASRLRAAFAILDPHHRRRSRYRHGKTRSRGQTTRRHALPGERVTCSTDALISVKSSSCRYTGAP